VGVPGKQQPGASRHAATKRSRLAPEPVAKTRGGALTKSARKQGTSPTGWIQPIGATEGLLGVLAGKRRTVSSRVGHGVRHRTHSTLCEGSSVICRQCKCIGVSAGCLETQLGFVQGSSYAGQIRAELRGRGVGQHGDDELDGDREHRAGARPTVGMPKFQSVAA
jgi:hypothetical protein